MLRQPFPVGAYGRKDVDHGRAFGTDRDLMVNARRDAPRPAWSELADFFTDGEREPAGDAHPELLVLVLVSGHDRVRSQLDKRQRDPFALDASSADGVAPQIEDGQRCEVDEVAHEAPSVGWGRGRMVRCAGVRRGFRRGSA